MEMSMTFYLYIASLLMLCIYGVDMRGPSQDKVAHGIRNFAYICLSVGTSCSVKYPL